MIQKQTDSYNMYIAVLSYLDKNSEKWTSNLIISKAVKSFRSSVTLIQQTSFERETGNRKNPVDREREIEQLISLTYRLALRVKNYAVGKKDLLLKQEVDFSRNEIEAGKESEIIRRCKNILSKAKGLINVPEEYKIKSELIEQLVAAINTLESQTANEAQGKEKLKQHDEKAGLEDLEHLFNSARAKLHILDDLIEGDADDNANIFVRKYFTTRRTVNLTTGENNKADKN